MAKLETSEARLKHALWGSRDELWSLDFRDGHIISLNPLPHLLRDSEFKFSSLDDLLVMTHPLERERLRIALDAHISEGADYYEATFRMRTKDDDWAWVMCRGRAVERDENGKAIWLSGTLRDVSDVKAVEDELRSVNERLEHRVDERTADLLESNRELSATLEKLRQMQTQLVESEKHASLGNLVAGVAHEINTPLGIGVTAASHLRSETERMARAINAGTITRSELSEYTQTAIESSDLVLKNLDRASKLVRSFKQVAVDQGSEECRTIELRSYFEELLFTLKPRMKRTTHDVQMRVPSGITLVTFPGALAQIILNLVMNSLTHAFAEGIDGTMTLDASEQGDKVTLVYSDNGIGMPENVRARIFEPFFTTKRGQGGSGLGMHIAYNLVTQVLRGTIRCASAPEIGVIFTIVMPKNVTETT